MSDTVIRVENLSKSYTISHQTGERYTALRDVLANGVKSVASSVWRVAGSRSPHVTRHSPPTTEEFWALNDVSFEVKQGERVGIIGRNGAGKSTLLKILSRITEPTKGRIHIKGRVASLLEVGTGFHPELTGRENIYLNGAILGMSREEIRRKFDEIVAFAGTEKFLDTPVKRYSSGMSVRLAFAVAAHLEPETLLVDEVLAVGDASFQKKCMGKMNDVAKKGRTVLFVSHNMGAINALCPRTIYLSQGCTAYDGDSQQAISTYLKTAQERTVSNLSERKDRIGTGTIRFTDTWIEDSQGDQVDTVLSGDNIKIVVEYNSSQKNSHSLSIALALKNSFGDQLSDVRNEDSGFYWYNTPEKGRIYCTLKQLPLNSGFYTYNIFCQVNGIITDWVQDAGGFTVEVGDFFGSGKLPDREQGQFLFKNEWELKPTDSNISISNTSIE